MSPDLFPILMDIRDSVGLYAVMIPENLREELGKRNYAEADAVTAVLTESRDHFINTRTKPRLNELKNLSDLISKFIHLDQKKVLFILNDLNDCIFKDSVCRMAS